MKRKYHTVEELRGALAARQKRWREKNRGYERVRAKNNYEKARRGSDEGDLPDGVGGVGIAEGEFGEADSDIGGGALPGTGRDEGIGARGQEQRGNVKSAGVGETTIGPVEGWDVIEEQRGGHGTIEREFGEDREGAMGVARGYTGGAGVRRVSGADKRVGSGGSGFKPGGEGRGVSGGQADELGTGGENGGGSGRGGQEGWTANEEATYRRLEELKARRASGGLNAGVEVELEL